MLVHQVETGLAERVGSGPSNFAVALPAPDSELAQQLVRDPYVFDHLALSERVAERELEQALMDRLQDTLLAFGHGMRSSAGRCGSTPAATSWCSTCCCATSRNLAVQGRNDTLVRYALAGAPAPLAVADYTYDTLPAQERGGLPTAAELAAALEPPNPPAGAGTVQQRRPG